MPVAGVGRGVWVFFSSPSFLTTPLLCVLGSAALQDAEPLYCAEQIKVPAQLPEIMKAWTKEVIRTNPPNIYEFSAKCVCGCGSLFVSVP